MNYEIILLYAGAWIILYVISKILKTNRHGLTVGPLYLVFKTRRFNKALERIASKKKYWRIIWNISVAIGLGQLCFILLSLTRNLLLLIAGGEEATQILLLLPGITISWESFPHILIALIVLLITHEAAHGVASVVEGIPLKSSGLFLAIIIPGAFVEPDEDELKRRTPLSQMRIFSAGSFANITIGFLAMLVLMNFTIAISPLYASTPQGLMIAGLVENGPAEKIGLQKGDVIFSLNNTPINDVKDLRYYMNSVAPNKPLTIQSDRGKYIIVTQPDRFNSSRALIGIYPFNYYPPRTSFAPKQLPYQIYVQVYWLNTILVSIALINMLPLYPLDGGRYLDSLMKLMRIKHINTVRFMVSAFSLLILGLNVILSMSIFGFNKI